MTTATPRKPRQSELSRLRSTRSDMLEQRREQVQVEVRIMEAAWRARSLAALLAEYTGKRRDGEHCYRGGDPAAIVAAGAQLLAELTEETVNAALEQPAPFERRGEGAS